MKISLIILLVLAMAMLSVVPAFARGPYETGPGDCNYGVVHAGLARAGLTGSVHFPGWMHQGASGFCEGLPNY
jgi:hypothetical protein